MLAVQLAADGGLYVVERVKRGIYSLSRLAPWVQEGDIVVAGKGWQGSRAAEMDVEAEEKPCAVPDALNWWQAAQVEEPPSDLGLGDELAGLQVAVVFGPPGGETGAEASFVDVVEHRSQSLAPVADGLNVEGESSFGPLESQGISGVEAMDVDEVHDTNEPDPKQSPEELLNGMRDHYLQALYVSKVRALLDSLMFGFDTSFSDIPGVFCQGTIDTMPYCVPNQRPRGLYTTLQPR